MNTKAIIAIAVAAAVIIAGCGIGIFFATNNNSAPAVDEAKDDVVVGDYYTFVLNYHTLTSDVRILDESEILDIFYLKGETSVGKENVMYNGKNYVCDKYVTESKRLTTWNNEFGVCLQSTYYKDDAKIGYALYDTNLDVNLQRQMQDIDVGADIEYDYFIGELNSVEGKEGFTVSERYGNSFIVNHMDLNIVKNSITYKIESISDGMVVYEGYDKTPRTIADFRANISMKDFEKWINEAGLRKEVISSNKTVMNTPYGQRDITYETVKLISPDMTASTYSIAYGEKGFIYSEEKFTLNGNTYTYTEAKLFETSMKK